jgi:hypothetical protein
MTTPPGWWGGYVDELAVRQAMAFGASQDPWELTAAMKLAAEVNPEIIVEIGCDRGGTLYAWRALCPRVYGITLEDNSASTGGSGLGLETHGAMVLVGDSHEPLARRWLLSCLIDAEDPRSYQPVDVLVLDGDHSAAGVRQDVSDYGPLVREGGLILLHDIDSVPDVFCPVEVKQVWPGLKARYATEEIRNPDSGGQGWGVIRVQPGDVF